MQKGLFSQQAGSCHATFLPKWRLHGTGQQHVLHLSTVGVAKWVGVAPVHWEAIMVAVSMARRVLHGMSAIIKVVSINKNICRRRYSYLQFSWVSNPASRSFGVWLPHSPQSE